MWAKLYDLALLYMITRFPEAATSTLSTISAAALKAVENSFTFSGWHSFHINSSLFTSIHSINFLQLLLNDSEPVDGKFITVGSAVIALKSRLGQGSQGTTFLGETSDASKVVVKIFNPFCSVRNPRDSYLSEVDVLKRLGRFIDSDSEKMIIVQDYIQGTILHSVLETLNPSIPEQRKLMTRLFLQYLEAVVSFSFETGYAHNDASPLNAILSNDQIILIDFGLATQTKEAEIGSTSDFDYALRELTMDFPTIKSQLLDL